MLWRLMKCPACTATAINTEQRLGSEILWFICRGCAHVWCAIVPPSPNDSPDQTSDLAAPHTSGAMRGTSVTNGFAAARPQARR